MQTTMEKPSAAYGMYSEPVEVAQVVHALNSVGFENETICLMLAPTHPIAGIVREANALQPERDSTAITEALIGWLSQFGAVVIPSLGFFIRSQAFLHALLVARDAPALCGNFRTLSGLGFPEIEARRLESELLQRAGFLVYVASAGTARAHFARELLASSGAREAAVLEKENAAEAAA